jgi:hypothetical protein
MDVRFNTGGNLLLASDLMRTLQERTRGIERFVITGRAAFSAGITAAAAWSSLRARGGLGLGGGRRRKFCNVTPVQVLVKRGALQGVLRACEVKVDCELLCGEVVVLVYAQLDGGRVRELQTRRAGDLLKRA